MIRINLMSSDLNNIYLHINDSSCDNEFKLDN